MSPWGKVPAQPITQREWKAIEEALTFRLAGPIEEDDESPVLADYEQAARKVAQRIK